MTSSQRLCHGRKGGEEIDKCNLRRLAKGSVCNFDLSQSGLVASVCPGAEDKKSWDPRYLRFFLDFWECSFTITMLCYYYLGVAISCCAVFAGDVGVFATP